MPPPVELPNVEFPRRGDGGYRCCRACCAAICDDAKAASRRCLPLPDGTVVHNIAVPLLDRASELTLRVVCRASRAALAGINPEWRPLWQWCSAIGYCIAPLPARVRRAARDLDGPDRAEALQELAPCRCGLPRRVGRYGPDAEGGPLTVTRQVIQLPPGTGHPATGTRDPATSTVLPAELRVLPRFATRALPVRTRDLPVAVAPSTTPAASTLPEQPSGSRRAWVPPPGWERPPRRPSANRLVPDGDRRTLLAALGLEPSRTAPEDLPPSRPEDSMPWSPRAED